MKIHVKYNDPKTNLLECLARALINSTDLIITNKSFPSSGSSGLEEFGKSVTAQMGNKYCDNCKLTSICFV
ncbi:unnamed protein product [Schistosoma margrebowiei]|uniref:Uncharacterized protein n=1 Tax=Schistosoma margrebowiei TaxID=48269 RepID=A0A183NBL9_9TREM|nr:unnamed protein product [Schistosoma margrebowiei]